MSVGSPEHGSPLSLSAIKSRGQALRELDFGHTHTRLLRLKRNGRRWIPRKRIKSEEDPGAAQPQLLNIDGQQRQVWPDHWGITLSQLQNLLKDCKREWDWNSRNSVRVLVERYIIPRTAGTGLGYALLVNRHNPREVNIMISHSWNENAEEFVETLARTVSEDDVMFICALSIFQNDDGSGPSIPAQLGSRSEESPFCQVLHHISRRGRAAGWRWMPARVFKDLPLVCLQLSIITYASAMSWSGEVPSFFDSAVLSINPRFLEDPENNEPLAWVFKAAHPVANILSIVCLVFCVLGLLSRMVVQTMRIYTGRMVAVPNREDDLYSRLWCVYEIFVATDSGIHVELARTLAESGVSNCRDAACLCAEDEARIRDDIEELGWERGIAGEDGYDMVDVVIRKTMRLARWPFITQSFRWSVVGSFCISAHIGIVSPEVKMVNLLCEPAWLYSAAFVFGFVSAQLLIYPILFSRGVEGRVSFIDGLSVTFAPMCCGLLKWGIGLHMPCDFAHYDRWAASCIASDLLIVAGSTMIVFGSVVGSYLVLLRTMTGEALWKRVVKVFASFIPAVLYLLCRAFLWGYRPTADSWIQVHHVFEVYGSLFQEIRTVKGFYPSLVFLFLDFIWQIIMTLIMWKIFAAWGVTRHCKLRRDCWEKCGSSSEPDESDSEF